MQVTSANIVFQDTNKRNHTQSRHVSSVLFQGYHRATPLMCTQENGFASWPSRILYYLLDIALGHLLDSSLAFVKEHYLLDCIF